MDIRVAAYGVITDEAGRILLSHWNEHGHSAWSMPGGGLEPGEDPADAAVREVFEETGFHVRLTDLLGIDSHVVPVAARTRGQQRALHAIRIVYRAEVTGGELTNEIGGSSDEAAWFSRDDIRELKRVSLVDIALGFAGV